jgi:hypothetical protein
MLNKGEIDIEEYNEAYDGTIAREAELNDLDYDCILDFAYRVTANKCRILANLYKKNERQKNTFCLPKKNKYTIIDVL